MEKKYCHEMSAVCVLLGLLEPWKMEKKYCHETSVSANGCFVISHVREELISAALGTWKSRIATLCQQSIAHKYLSEVLTQL
jgi:hypothetical protein